jgi:PST family polysaccharide transporter
VTASTGGGLPPTNIRRATVRGSFWTVLSGLFTRSLGVVGTLILTRYLAPYDYGEVSAATVLAMTANQFSTLGVGTYLITHPSADREVMFHATLVHVGLGFIAFAMVLLLGHNLAPMVGAPTLVRYLPGMVLTVAIDRVAFVPERVLVRRLEFGSLAVIRGSGEIIYTVISLALAALGWGGMAIVAANLVRSGARFALLGARVPWRDWIEPHRLNGRVLRDIAAFGSVVYLGAFAIFASRRWDNLAISYLYGPAVLGAYNLAYNLADVPAVQIGEQVSDVLQAAFARTRHEDRKGAMLRSLPLLTLIMVPMAVGLGVVAPTLGRVFFDQRWAEVGPMLLVLAVISFPRPLTGVVLAYLQVKLRPRLAAAIEIATFVLLMGLLFTLGRLGPLWACAAVGLAFIARLPLTAYVLQKVDQVPVSQFLIPLIPPILCAAPLCVAVLAVRSGIRATGIQHAWVSLIAEVLAGGLAYLCAILLFARGLANDLLSLLHGGFRRSGSPPENPPATQ